MTTQLIIAICSTLITLGFIKVLAAVLKTRNQDLSACFASVLATAMIMGGVIHFMPPFNVMEEYMQFLITVGLSALVYSVFLNTSIFKSILLAIAQFFVQLVSVLGIGILSTTAMASLIFG